MSYTTIIKQDGTVTQDTTTSFTDGRIWKLATGESLRILGNKVLKMGNNGAKLFESEDLLTDKFTLAVNREEDKVSVIRKGLEPIILNTSILSTNSIGVVAIPDITPLRAIIDKTGEKIWWLGSNKTIYLMGLDGGNIESLYLNISNSTTHTFTVSVKGVAYLLEGIYPQLWKIQADPITGVLTETHVTIGFYSGFYSLDCFSLNNVNYFLGEYRDVYSRGKMCLVRVDKNNDIIWKRLDVEYGLEGYNTACQFNASGYDNFATFFGEKDGVMRRWQVDLDTLDCTPARWETYPTKQVFSNDTNLSLVDYSGVNGNNADPGNLITSCKGCTGAI